MVAILEVCANFYIIRQMLFNFMYVSYFLQAFFQDGHVEWWHLSTPLNDSTVELTMELSFRKPDFNTIFAHTKW